MEEYEIKGVPVYVSISKYGDRIKVCIDKDGSDSLKKIFETHKERIEFTEVICRAIYDLLDKK